MKALSLLLVTLAFSVSAATAAENDDKNRLTDHPFAGLALRGIGPAITSGRISDFAFHPERKQEYYVATASGNLWKTTNNGITWDAIFENEGSYALGVVTLDPGNPPLNP